MLSHPPTPYNESERLSELHSYSLLDTPPEDNFDDLVHLAADICGTPIALISLIDSQRQWFKVSVGLYIDETPRDDSFCAYAIAEPNDLLIVINATEDGRFATNPLVTDDPHIRFYAGAPLLTQSGHTLGTLCVLDRVPRSLSPAQQNALRVLSRQVVTQIEQRRQIIELRQATAAREASELYAQQLAIESQRQAKTLALLDHVRTALTYQLDLSAALRTVVEASAAAFGYSHMSLYLREGDQLLLQHQVGYTTPLVTLSLAQGIIGRVVRSGKLALISNIHADPDFVADDRAIVSEVCVPLWVQGAVVGVLNIESTCAASLAASDLDLLQALGTHVSAAIERVRLYSDLQRTLRETLLLNRVIAASGTTRDVVLVLNVICQELARAFEVPQAACALLDDDQLQLTVVSEYCGYGRLSAMGLTIPVADNPLTQQLMNTSAPVQVSDIASDPRTRTTSEMYALRGTAAILIIPLLVGDSVIGTIGIDSLTPRVFSIEEVALAQAVAWAAGQALANVQLTAALQLELAERSRTEAALRHTTARVTGILESITDAFFNLDVNWGFTYVNQAAEQMHGQPREQLIGQEIWAALPQLRGTLFDEYHHRAMAEQCPQQFAAYYPPFDLWLEVRDYPSPEGLSVYFRDISAQKRAHIELVKAKEDAEAATRSKAEDLARGLFAASLAKPIKVQQLYEVLLSVLGSAFERRPPAPARPTYDAHMAEHLPLRILLAEDNTVNQRVATRTLERLGYRIDMAANGCEALEALQRQPYDLVLMDVQMPELDGLSATRRIRSEITSLRQPRIIAMTASAMQGDRELCLAAGMDDYISKPMHVDELVAALERTCPAIAASASVQTTQAIDRSVLDQLQASLGAGEPAIVRECIDLFLESTPAQIRALQQAWGSRATKDLHGLAHLIKSSAAIIGALGLAKQCNELEEQARRGQILNAAPIVRAIVAGHAEAMTTSWRYGLPLLDELSARSVCRSGLR